MMRAVRDALRRCTAWFDAFLRDHPWISLAVLIIGIGIAPRVLSANQLNVAILIGMYMIAATGLNITVGVTGLLDLGFVGFMAVGAYTVAIAGTTFELNFWLALAIGTVHSALWGLLRGAPTLRLSGDYFAIVTFGFAELVRLAVKNKPLANWTRGARGFPGIEGPSLFGKEFSINPPVEFWYLVAILLVLTVFSVRRLVFSRVGRAWTAIREDETAAIALGINVQRYRAYTFAVSAGLGGLAGGFYAGYLQNLHPDSFRFLESVWVLCMVVIGGMGSITGPLIGAVIFMSVRELLRTFISDPVAWIPERLQQLYETTYETTIPNVQLPPDALYLVFGLVLVLIMRFRPEGLVSTRTMRAELHSSES